MHLRLLRVWIEALLRLRGLNLPRFERLLDSTRSFTTLDTLSNLLDSFLLVLGSSGNTVAPLSQLVAFDIELVLDVLDIIVDDLSYPHAFLASLLKERIFVLNHRLTGSNSSDPGILKSLLSQLVELSCVDLRSLKDLHHFVDSLRRVDLLSFGYVLVDDHGVVRGDSLSGHVHIFYQL